MGDAPLSLRDVEPMLAEDRKLLPTLGSWHYEIKYDGYRMLAGTSPRALKTRNGADATTWFPEVVSALSALPLGAHILDGEVCVLDDIGRFDFNRLHTRARRRGWYPGADPVVYCVFDLLVYRGKDIRGEPIEARKRRLAQLLSGQPDGVLFVQSEEDGAWLYQCALDLRLEGVVAKRAVSEYAAGRSSNWLKIKRPGAVLAAKFHREP
ncbi:hypothetical protein [Cupriavidus necator]|uniref:ATP-dependent DNA ligase n=1 Tax=Cupriavidus necator TaxID=106590 RepID=UPI0005B37F2A|nr:hypothetical protein [Cupriavidus necator]